MHAKSLWFSAAFICFYYKEKRKMLTEAETPQPTLEACRSRKKKSFGADFVNEDSEGTK